MKYHSNTKLKVEYVDDKDEHTTTIGRLRQRLIGYGFGQDRIDGIIEDLTSKGTTTTGFATYTIIEKTVVEHKNGT